MGDMSETTLSFCVSSEHTSWLEEHMSAYVEEDEEMSRPIADEGSEGPVPVFYTSRGAHTTRRVLDWLSNEGIPALGLLHEFDMYYEVVMDFEAWSLLPCTSKPHDIVFPIDQIHDIVGLRKFRAHLTQLRKMHEQIQGYASEAWDIQWRKLERAWRMIYDTMKQDQELTRIYLVDQPDDSLLAVILDQEAQQKLRSLIQELNSKDVASEVGAELATIRRIPEKQAEAIRAELKEQEPLNWYSIRPAARGLLGKIDLPESGFVRIGKSNALRGNVPFVRLCLSTLLDPGRIMVTMPSSILQCLGLA